MGNIFYFTKKLELLVLLCLVLLQVPKFFVSDQKFIYILCQSQTFCARQKDDYWKPADTVENTFLYLYLTPPEKRNPLILLSSNQGEPKYFLKNTSKFQFKFNLSPNLDPSSNPNLYPVTLYK